jgi:hypothetical protein
MTEEVVDDKTLDEQLTASIRDTLHTIQERPAEETGLPEKDATDAVDAPAGDAPARARDATGKFTKNESSAPVVAPDKGVIADDATKPSVASPVAPGADDSPMAFDINRAPSSWKPAAKAEWANLPEGIRAEIHRREGDFHNTVLKPMREDATFGQTIKQVLAPYQMLIEAEGGTPDRAIADTMKTAALFRVGTQEQKLNALFQIDKQFNGGLAQHFQQAVAAEVAKQTGQPVQNQQPAEFRDPRVDQLLQAQQQQERARLQNEERANNEAAGRFLSSTNDKGQPLYPFVDNVLPDMTQRAAVIRGANPHLAADEVLKKAYEEAVWANPETRAVLVAQTQASQPEANLQRVEQARRASAGNLPKRGALPASSSPGPLKFGTPDSDESIRETYRQLTTG